MTLWHMLVKRWKEAKRDKIGRYLVRYRSRRAKLDRKQLKAQQEYDALRAELAGQTDKAQTIRAGGIVMKLDR